VSSPETLLEEVYDELRDLARRIMRRGPPGQTLEPTALVHEAYLRLARRSPDGNPWESRAHFLAVAAKAMRQVLANHARNRKAQKRDKGGKRVTLSEAPAETGTTEVDMMALHDALTELAAHDPRKAELVEMRFFGGLTVPEIAHVLNISTATVEREWRVAKAWIGARLK
jgi:RNA polymerase sigma factor (TIGR02999 family)